MSSREWQRFIDNYYGDPYMMWHDGIDEKTVTFLKGAERTKAEEMLIESLQEGNHYAAIGLRELRSEKAIPYLLEAMYSGWGNLRVHAAVALSMIENTFEYVDEIIQVLKQSAAWTYRMRAAIELRHFPLPSVVEALFESVAEDPDYIVRNHASETILFLHGLKPSISERREIFQHMIVEYNKEGQPTTDALNHYRISAELLQEVIESEGKLRKNELIDDIWSW
jgi:hypothetical protein